MPRQPNVLVNSNTEKVIHLCSTTVDFTKTRFKFDRQVAGTLILQVCAKLWKWRLIRTSLYTTSTFFTFFTSLLNHISKWTQCIHNLFYFDSQLILFSAIGQKLKLPLWWTLKNSCSCLKLALNAFHIKFLFLNLVIKFELETLNTWENVRDYLGEA